MTPLKETTGPPTSRSTRLASRECGIARRAASAQGDGAAVVLSARESRVQGEGRQVSAARGQGGRRDAERHNCSGASRANGRQTLERRIR